MCIFIVKKRGFISAMRKLDDLLSRAYQIILEQNKKGIIQSKLWKELGASSREGSRLSLKLEEKKFIRRERELHNGRWTYRLFTTRQPITITSILDVPCTTCPVILKCGAGSNISPEVCDKLEIWLKDLIGKKEICKED